MPSAAKRADTDGAGTYTNRAFHAVWRRPCCSSSLGALDTKYVRDDTSRMQELHIELSQLMLTAKNGYDLFPTIEKLHRICAEHIILVDGVFAGQTFIWMEGLPDQQYAAFKTA